ncbi:MAG: PKD domain-containing protein, partial [Pseudonocardiaceae bacterium]
PAAVAGGYHFVGSTRVFRALASGSMCWTDISGVVSGTVRVITPLKVGSAVHTYAGTTAGAIYYSANAAGTNLANVTGNYPGGSVSDIAIDPTNPSRVFVTRSAFGGSKLYRSTTAGGTWTAMGSGLPDIPASSVAIDPLNVSRIFVGTDVGVFESTGGGANYFAYSPGPPQGLVVSDLEIDNSPHMLTAGTYGRGAWQINLGTTGNAAPVANYNHTINGLTVTFTDTSTDSDGTIAARNWNFGDGTSSTTANPSKAYGSAGTYQVALTVTDNASATNTLTKAITVTAGSSCSTGTAYSGSFSGANGQTQIQPNGTWYQSTTSGTHIGCLDGPTGTDYDLYLDKWNGSAWAQVSASTTSAPDETINYQGTAGYYQFRIKNYSGTGSYTFTLTRPQ